VRCCLGQSLDGYLMQVSQAPGHLDNIGWFVAFAAIRDRREIWTIGFYQKSIERDATSSFSEIFSLLKGQDAGERNHKAKF